MRKHRDVIEMIITSISTNPTYFAKILGIIAVAVTQIILIVLMAVICIFAFDLKTCYKVLTWK